MGNWSTQFAMPGDAWLPLGLGALAPLLLAGVIVASRSRRRGIATVLALRTVLVLGFGFAVLAAVATLAVVQTGLNELRERHRPDLRALGDILERNPLGPVSGDAVLRLALFRAKDPSVGFVAAGTNSCRSSCVVSAAEAGFDAADLKRRLIADWPAKGSDGQMIEVGGRPYLLIGRTIRDVGATVGATVVAGVDAEYLTQQATRTAWVLLSISYALLVVVGWTSWRHMSRSLSTRIHAITTQLKSGSVHEGNERLEVDGHELRELADSVADYLKRNVNLQRSSDERYRRLVELAPDAVLICSQSGIQFANSAAIALAGAKNRYDLMGLPIGKFLEYEESAAQPGAAASVLRPAKWKRIDGAVFHVEVAEVMDSTDGDQIKQYVVRDMTNRHLREAALAHRAEHDSLTGLVNRARFEARLVELLELPRPIDPTAVRNIAVLFIDLDGFKPVNDQYGHAAGDAVLVAVGVRLRDSTRGTDLIARFGGDEFAVLLQVRDQAEVRTVAQRILNNLRQPILFEGSSITVGASLGVVTARPNGPADAADPQPPFDSRRAAAELLRTADAAMYEAKSGGGGRFVVPANPQSPDQAPDVSFYATA
ncbi:MAG: sensor domain-containing diguanylate cyclase [bacterium]